VQFLLVWLAAVVAIPQVHRTPTPWRSDPVLVRAVIDGDTISVQTIGRVTLLGITAPDIGRAPATSAPFAIEAKARLTSLLLNRWVRLEDDGPRSGMSGRMAYVITGDNQFVNAVLVREGLARVTARTFLTRLDELRHAEREAQQSRRGIWGGTPQIPTAGYTPPPKRSR
jgi:endonuclease YncB( thermonuclease family)